MSGFEIEGVKHRLPLHSTGGMDGAGADEATTGLPLTLPLTLRNIAKALAEFDDDVSSRAASQFFPQTLQKSLYPPLVKEKDIVSELMRNARFLIANHERRMALNILRGVLQRAPDHVEALLETGLCLREIGRVEEALKTFRALIRIRRDAGTLALLAETLYLMERDKEALAIYRDVLRSVASEPQSEFKPESELESESDPDPMRLFETYKNVGNIHVRAGDFESAEEYYDKAYTLCPDSDTLMVNYGTLELQRERLGEAVLRFRRAVELNPGNDRGWVGLAMVHRLMGDHELACANIERALDINGNNRTALRLAVDWSAQDHRFDAAIPRLQDYVVTNGEDAEMAFLLAKMFTQRGRLREARLEMERVLALDPGIEGGESLKAILDREIARFDGNGRGSENGRGHNLTGDANR